MIEDVWGDESWRSTWCALPRERRRDLLLQLRRGEAVRGAEEAVLTLREARRLHRTAPMRALAGVAAVLGAHVLLGWLLNRPLTAGDAATLLLLGGAGVLWGSLSQRRSLDRGIAVNVAALTHWVEHDTIPGPGPPPAGEAARLLRIIDDEGWTRPHR